MRNLLFIVSLFLFTLAVSCHTNHKSDEYKLYLFEIEDGKFANWDTTRLEVEKRKVDDTTHFVYKVNLDLYGRIDTFRYFMKTDSILYNRSFDFVFNDSIETKTVCPFVLSKQYLVKGKRYTVDKYCFLDMYIYWSKDYDFLLEVDPWRGLSIEYNYITKVLIDSILKDKSDFAKLPEDLSFLPTPYVN